MLEVEVRVTVAVADWAVLFKRERVADLGVSVVGVDAVVGCLDSAHGNVAVDATLLATIAVVVSWMAENIASYFENLRLHLTRCFVAMFFLLKCFHVRRVGHVGRETMLG